MCIHIYIFLKIKDDHHSHILFAPIWRLINWRHSSRPRTCIFTAERPTTTLVDAVWEFKDGSWPEDDQRFSFAVQPWVPWVCLAEF